jgi:hypothetical protein
MFKRLLFSFVLFSFAFVAFLYSPYFQATEVVAENAESAYSSVGVRAGVWDDGQAALWDLNIIDHFHYFGPKERARGHAPVQPIAFSHVRHVQKNKMDCQFCHWTVNKSSYSAVPELETCVGCHNYVKGTTKQQKVEIQKIHWYDKNSGIPYYLNEDGSVLKKSGDDASEYLATPTGRFVEGPDGKPLKDVTNQSVPIPWQTVHVMPNYVSFSHKRHVKAGVSCHSCHGQVPEMDVVERVTSMKMGWCISCHRAEGTSIDCATCHQ